jgi:hypothetical protein
MQHELAYRLQPAVDQAVFVRCTKNLENCLCRRFAALSAAQGVTHNPFNFFCFHPDFGWTGASTGP